jgi:hypothetical protein
LLNGFVSQMNMHTVTMACVVSVLATWQGASRMLIVSEVKVITAIIGTWFVHVHTAQLQYSHATTTELLPSHDVFILRKFAQADRLRTTS